MSVEYNRWNMEKEALVSSKPAKSTARGFRQSNSCVIGEELWRWYCSTRSATGGKLSKAVVQARAKWAFHQAGMIDFKASDGWYRRWINRWRNSNTTFETENVVQIQQTEQTKQTDWELSQDSSKHLKPDIIETESTLSSNKQTDVNNLPSSSAFVDTEFADPQSNIIDSPKDISDSSKSEEEMFDYWNTFLNCNTNFANIDSDLTQNCMEFFTSTEDSNFPIDVDELASAFLESQSQFPLQNESLHRRRLNDCRVHRKRGERYLPRFKEKVLSYISSHNIKTTAEKFRVHKETVSRWKNHKLASNSNLPTSNTSTDSKKSTDMVHMSADKQLLAWLRRCRVRQISFTSDELHKKVRQLMSKENSEASPRWFIMWTERLGKELVYEEGMEFIDRQAKNIQYPEAFKREIAAFAVNRSQVSVAKLFTISRRRISDWVQTFGPKLKETDNVSEENDEEFLGNKKKKKPYIWITDPDIDQQLWIWYQSQTPRPNSNQVRAKGVEMYHAKGYMTMSCSHGWYRRWSSRYNMTLCHSADDQILQWALTQMEANLSLTHHNLQVYALKVLGEKQAGFKASSGWVLRFCRRHPKLLQLTPTLTTPLPHPLLLKVKRFRQLIQSTIQTHSLSPGVIGNVDELHISFSSPVNVPTAKKQFLLRKSPMEKCHVTIVLACLSDGNMLPPTVILKGSSKDVPREAEASNLLVLFQDSAVLDDNCMAEWLSKVWFRFVPSPNLLITDCYPPHCTTNIKQTFAANQCILKVISGGCTSKLQPLDVAIKKTFHNLIEQQWNKISAQRNSALSSPWESVGKFEMPSLSNILDWVTSAYEYIQTTKQETVRRSFLVTGLTVSSNHSEDHFIDNMSMMPQDIVI